MDLAGFGIGTTGIKTKNFYHEENMIRLIKLVTSEEIVGEATFKEHTVSLKRPCAIMLIQSRSTPDQHSMALIPYAAYAKNHTIEIQKDKIVWESELEEDVYNQYNAIFGSGIQIVTNKGSNPQLNVV